MNPFFVRICSLEGLEPRKKLRQKLHCNPFSWFIKTVAKTTVIPHPNSTYQGNVRTLSDSLNCLTQIDDNLVVKNCKYDTPLNYLAITWSGSLKVGREDHCIKEELGKVSVSHCSIAKSVWRFLELSGDDKESLTFYYADEMKPVGRLVVNGDFNGDVNGGDAECLAIETTSNIIVVEPCRVQAKSQLWIFQYRFEFTN